MVEVKKLRIFSFFTFSAVPARPALACGTVRICKAPDEPSAGIVRGEALAVAPCEFVACGLVFGSCRVVCAPALGVARSRVRSPPGPQQFF